ncbi:MAG: hypothetical protein NC320_02010 [Clostridium sp.]|nr:hypothetical protein [Clostridium sp.]
MKIYKNGELLEPKEKIYYDNTVDETEYDIFCMAKIGQSAKPAFCVCVNPDAGRVGEPYLKYYNAQNYNKAEAVIRLGLKEPKFIYHKDGKKQWNVTKRELKQLNEFMSKKSIDDKPYTNWQSTLYHWNYEYGFLDSDYPEEYDRRIDAFFDGFYDTKENLAEPSYLPSCHEQILYADMM